MGDTTLKVKDALSVVKELRVDSLNDKLVSNHTLISTVTGSNVTLFYKDGPNGWSFDPDPFNPDPETDPYDYTLQIVQLADLDTSGSRKSIIIHNKSPQANCYVIVGGSDVNFGEFPVYPYQEPYLVSPPIYSFMLDAGETYFADYATAALKHLLFVSREWESAGKNDFTVAVTEVY